MTRCHTLSAFSNNKNNNIKMNDETETEIKNKTEFVLLSWFGVQWQC